MATQSPDSLATATIVTEVWLAHIPGQTTKYSFADVGAAAEWLKKNEYAKMVYFNLLTHEWYQVRFEHIPAKDVLKKIGESHISPKHDR